MFSMDSSRRLNRNDKMRQLLFGLLWCAGLTGGFDAANAQELSPAAYSQLRAKVDVTEAELCWQKVNWLPYWDGLVAAQQQDRPIFYWVYFGDPRGGC